MDAVAFTDQGAPAQRCRAKRRIQKSIKRGQTERGQIRDLDSEIGQILPRKARRVPAP